MGLLRDGMETECSLICSAKDAVCDAGEQALKNLNEMFWSTVAGDKALKALNDMFWPAVTREVEPSGSHREDIGVEPMWLTLLSAAEDTEHRASAASVALDTLDIVNARRITRGARPLLWWAVNVAKTPDKIGNSTAVGNECHESAQELSELEPVASPSGQTRLMSQVTSTLLPCRGPSGHTNNDGHEGLAKVSSTNWCKCWAIQVDEGRPAGCDDTGHVGHDKVLYWQGLMILGDFGEPPSAIIDLQ